MDVMASEVSLSAGTILVVDDTPDSLRFLTSTLETARITVLIATDGEAALDLLDHVIPDLILMDAVMPGMDGFEATRRIKRDPRIDHIPVIFMTGLTDTENVVRGFETGGVDYVQKPIVVDELLARIRVHLANARASQDSRIALDSTGRPLVAIDRAGDVLWSTPRAGAMLERLFPEWREDDRALPVAVIQALRRAQSADAGEAPAARFDVPGGRVEFSLLRKNAAEEWLFLVTEVLEGGEEKTLASRHGLTSREAEVLLWISRGKPNREISEILGISPRTVNKHLEQVFEKLGVENRASAAAFAVRTLGQWR
jgi:DNA-binding NarL/FixJ family response regulator